MSMAVGWPLTVAIMTARTVAGIVTGAILLVWLQKRPVAESIIQIVQPHVLLALLRLSETIFECMD